MTEERRQATSRQAVAKLPKWNGQFGVASFFGLRSKATTVWSMYR